MFYLVARIKHYTPKSVITRWKHVKPKKDVNHWLLKHICAKCSRKSAIQTTNNFLPNTIVKTQYIVVKLRKILK